MANEMFVNAGTLCGTCGKVSTKAVATIEKATGARMLRNPKTICTCGSKLPVMAAAPKASKRSR